MKTCLSRWAPDDADSLARAFAGAGIGLGALAANRKAAQVTDTAIAFDTLQAFEVHADFTAQITFNDVLPILNRMHNLRELLLSKVLGTDGGVDVGLGQDIDCVAGTDAVDITQGDVDALVWRNFYTNDTSHKIVTKL